MPFLGDLFGNPHSIDHSFGWETSRAIKDARARVANLINADDDEIVFTSGATESCNLALRGVANRSGNGRRNRIVTLATEHPAVLETVLDLGRSGLDAVVLPVGSDGLLDLGHLDKVLDERTLIVSVMAANNEIGVLQPISDIAVRCQAAGALFHTDATQAAGRIPIDVDDWQVDLLSFSSHKVYGPKGVGALFVRSGLQLKPIITGGSQEGGTTRGNPVSGAHRRIRRRVRTRRNETGGRPSAHANTCQAPLHGSSRSASDHAPLRARRKAARRKPAIPANAATVRGAELGTACYGRGDRPGTPPPFRPDVGRSRWPLSP